VAPLDPIRVAVEVLESARGLGLPAYATDGASGMDLLAAVEEPIVLAPGARALVPTGLRLAVPAGYEAQLRARSGLALRHGVVVPNAPGTVDSDFRGEVRVILQNLGTEPFRVERGMRFAQLVFCPVARATLVVESSLEATARGSGGFGHTGL
jgi:dUTP pyrophosphatase